MKTQALATFLAIEETEIRETQYKIYKADGNEYSVLTDEEADEQVSKYIKNTLWAFNPTFITNHSNTLDYSDDSLSLLKIIQEECESANGVIGKLIDNIDEFIEDAISEDGRGHFIGYYDGEENEHTIDGITYYIYRTN